MIMWKPGDEVGYGGFKIFFINFDVINSSVFAQMTVLSNRPFAVYDHMVQKPLCWRANCPLGHPKQSNLT